MIHNLLKNYYQNLDNIHIENGDTIVNNKLQENSFRDDTGKILISRWYASKYPDDEVGVEQLDGIYMEDALKDRSTLDHCDTQVRDRVYAQLDKYIPIQGGLRESSQGGADGIKNVKDWYVNRYPTDELGKELNPNFTFYDVIETLNSGRDVYDDLFYEVDSIIRERIFAKTAEIFNVDYDSIYYAWLSEGRTPVKLNENLNEDSTDVYGSWYVKFDLTLDGEEVRWEDLSETTQEHIADSILDGYAQGEIVEMEEDDVKTGWWVAKIDCYLDDKGECSFDDIDECSQEHVAQSIKDGYTSGELCVTRDEINEEFENPYNPITFDEIVDGTYRDLFRMIDDGDYEGAKAEIEEIERQHEAEVEANNKRKFFKYPAFMIRKEGELIAYLKNRVERMKKNESLEDMDNRCEKCNTLLNDQGTCPKCDDGEEDYGDRDDSDEKNESVKFLGRMAMKG